MSVEKVRAYLTPYGVAQRIRELEVSSATVELAAAALGVAPARIAKTLSFKVGERPILVVAAGDARIDNSKYKHFFGVKAKMLTPEEAVEHIGHAVGGVCPFALPEDVSVYLDESLRRFETVFPAVGSAASAIVEQHQPAPPHPLPGVVPRAFRRELRRTVRAVFLLRRTASAQTRPGNSPERRPADRDPARKTAVHRRQRRQRLRGPRRGMAGLSPDGRNNRNRPFRIMISLIVAVAENGVIGDRNALLWHISEDLRHFKAVTTGHPVVMGRKTWESLGRPLPNRTNVVITRQNIEIPGCTVVHSLEEAVALFPADEEVFVIGGAQIYAAALPLARKFYLTRVFRAYEGDTRFPAWDEREWRLVSSESFSGGKDYPWPFAFELYERR